jgi:hypothetical protein
VSITEYFTSTSIYDTHSRDEQSATCEPGTRYSYFTRDYRSKRMALSQRMPLGTMMADDDDDDALLATPALRRPHCHGSPHH